MATECVRCARPVADQAYACSACTASAGRSLAEIAETTSAARDVANGLSRRSQGGASGKPGSRLPLDLAATSKLGKTEDRLTRWCRQIATKRGLVPPWVTTYGDPITAACDWLSRQTEWIRHQGPTTDKAWLHVFGWDPAEVEAIDPDEPPIIASAFLGYVNDAARTIKGIVTEPKRRYLGPCGATRWCCDRGEHPGHFGDDETCDGDVYGRAGGDKGTCRTCGAQVDQGERREWLDGEVRSHAYTAAEIADAYPIKANTIRKWLSRGLLTTHGELGGRPLMLLGEVLDLAAGDAARREEARATRARRSAARAAESETAA